MAGGVCTLLSPRRAVAVQAGPSPAPGADAAFSPPPAPAASAAHVLSDGGCSRTPLVWLRDQCPASTGCQSGPCPGKEGRGSAKRIGSSSHAVLQCACEQHRANKEVRPCCEALLLHLPHPVPQYLLTDNNTGTNIKGEKLHE